MTLYPYVFTLMIILIGLHAIIVAKNLLKKVIGLSILQAGVILFFIVYATKHKATVPIIDPVLGTDPSNYMNPLPHGLMLTAIVVAVATTGTALSLLIDIYNRFGTLDEDDILKKT